VPSVCASFFKNALWNNKASNKQWNNWGEEQKWTITLLNDLHNIIVIAGT